MRHRSWQKAKTLGLGGVNQPGVTAVKKKNTETTQFSIENRRENKENLKRKTKQFTEITQFSIGNRRGSK